MNGLKFNKEHIENIEGSIWGGGGGGGHLECFGVGPTFYLFENILNATFYRCNITKLSSFIFSSVII